MHLCSLIYYVKGGTPLHRRQSKEIGIRSIDIVGSLAHPQRQSVHENAQTLGHLSIGLLLANLFHCLFHGTCSASRSLDLGLDRPSTMQKDEQSPSSQSRRSQLPPLAPRHSQSSSHDVPSGHTSGRPPRLSHRSRAGCWTCRARKVRLGVAKYRETMLLTAFIGEM